MNLPVLPFWLKYALLGLLLLVIGVQTVRLSNAHVELANAKAREEVVRADISVQREAGLREGIALQQAAQAAVEAKKQVISQELLLEAAKREEALVKQNAHLDQLLKDGKWLCLRAPLPVEVLSEFTR